MNDLELNLMQIISFSGECKALCFEALQLFRKGETENVDQKLNEAKTNLLQANRVHAKMLQAFASGVETPADLLTMHAEDQMMSAETILALVEEFLNVLAATRETAAI